MLMLFFDLSDSYGIVECKIEDGNMTISPVNMIIL